ncbi:MAG: UDP-N-acetylmuramoyl-L-alanyl-D-glutamate--2,6-diaminopimelate ligase [Rhodospirillaceae bacterium]|nr:UDP-N-acetylmuramoyl-L-alanyl-D-glutamate--2,6-diaminopimelate ligase [Rhodospirillaceae bacterium]
MAATHDTPPNGWAARPPAGVPGGGDDARLAAALPGLTADSRAVKPGWLFAALEGRTVDGHAYIGEAVTRGAAIVVARPGTQLPPAAEGVELIEDVEPRSRYARLAAAFYGRQPEVIAAVTGTNGKTSTAQFARQIWQAEGFSSASLGTLGLTAPGLAQAGTLTTPDPMVLHAALADLVDTGVTHAALEASSHGLDQHRLDGVQVRVAAFTNLSRDHLDYHGTLESYWAAKRRLFADVLAPDGAAVVNADTPQAEELVRLAEARGQTVVRYGTAGREVQLVSATPQLDGLLLHLKVFGRAYQVRLPLVGLFQAQNACCALGIALASDTVEPGSAVAALESLTGVAGRLELAATHPSGAPVFVDYAHTPDALETVLASMRPHVHHRLIVVFGCGGDRDRGKRPIMGEVVSRLADLAIVTDDNPRSEDPAAIRAQILAAAPRAEDIGDRAAAIRSAIAELHEGDILVIAGKGHEQGQQVGKEIRPFDDVVEARRAMAEVTGRRSRT